MSAPLVSIVIPCFNQGRYLDDAIASCLAQTWRDLEVIVVDDGSTDDTCARMQRASAGDSRVRGVSTANAGLGAARNRGLAAARGEYVNFLDADDLLERDKIERQLSVIRQSPDVGLVLCDAVSVDGQGNRLQAPRLALDRLADPDGLFPALLAGGFFPPHVPLVRRALVERAGGFSEDRRLAGHADYLLWLSIAALGVRVAIVGGPLVRYRRSADGMSADVDHMASSRLAALATVAARQPHAIARGIVELAHALSEARYANAVLSGRFLHALETSPRAAAHLARLRVLDRILESPGPLFVWGAGTKGREVVSALRALGRRPAAVIDRDPARWGTALDGVPIVSPETLAGHRPNPGLLVVIASVYHDEIARTLAASGIDRFVVAPPEALVSSAAVDAAVRRSHSSVETS